MILVQKVKCEGNVSPCGIILSLYVSVLWSHLSAHVSLQIGSENLPKLDSSFVLSKNKNMVDIIAGLLLDMIK